MKSPKTKFHGNPIQWEPTLIHADRRTDIMKLTEAFRDYANAPKNQ